MPIFVSRAGALNLTTRVQRYHEMRHYGRLASVHVNVEMGFPELGDVLHFWNENSAKAALEDLRKSKIDPEPRIFNPMNVYCTVWP
jgi:hypothetical protein